jgi:hypothetical protein
MSTGTLAYINFCPLSGMQELLKIEGSPPGTTPWVLLLGEIAQTTRRIKKLVIYVSGNFNFVPLRGSCVG